jgi:hypothetical protein
VSLILRFIAPREYGIQSEPVEHVLGISHRLRDYERARCSGFARWTTGLTEARKLG